jgi:hypothetical protein
LIIQLDAGAGHPAREFGPRAGLQISVSTNSRIMDTTSSTSPLNSAASDDPDFLTNCLVFGRQCAVVAAVAIIISAILFSARSMPKDAAVDVGSERIASPLPVPARARAN